MKNYIPGIFHVVFIVCLPLSLFCLIGGSLTLTLFSLGIISDTNETVHEFMVIIMLAAPVGIGITFSKPVFQNLAVRHTEIKAELSDTVRWMVRKVDAIAFTMYEVKTFFIRIYTTYYTTFFRWMYGLSSLFVMMTTVGMLPLVYDKEVVAILIITSITILGLTTKLNRLYLTATRNQTSINKES